jgi:predicted transcriptional regulator
VLVDVHSYDESQETLALLKILAIGEKEIEAGKTVPIEEVIAEFRARSSGVKKPRSEVRAKPAKAKS